MGEDEVHCRQHDLVHSVFLIIVRQIGDLVAAFEKHVQEQGVQANLGCSTPIAQLDMPGLIWLAALKCDVNIVEDAAAQLGHETEHRTALANDQRVNGGREQIDIPVLNHFDWFIQEHLRKVQV